MAQQNGYEVYRLVADDGTVEAEIVPALGAIVSSLRLPAAGGLREVLFQHPFFWDPQAQRTRGGIPFLFPVCGRLERDGQAGAWLYDGQVRQMTIHGFSMRLPWEVLESGPSHLAVALRDTEATRMAYPFAFEVVLRFTARGGALSIEQEYRNRGDEPMPYYAGFHPYYLTPEPGPGKDAVRLELPVTSMLRYNDRLTDVVGRDAAPPMPQSVSSPAIHERLTEVTVAEATLRYPDGLALHTRADGVEDPGMFPLVQLYTMADRPFFCVEPWMGFPNALNAVKGVRWLGPGRRESGVLKVWTTQS